MAKRFTIKWLPQPKAKNYPAAREYLSLLFNVREVASYVRRLQRAPVVHFKSKDIFRASQLSLLGVSNFFVEKDRKKILDGEALSPILLVRDSATRRVIVADGYHRLCSVYTFDEEAEIPCKIV
ncbi:MAG: hypothetical protein H7Y14_02370 [Burkholderiales bacterium]|nr:hypothetical protein [Burkholderiales bacterium]